MNDRELLELAARAAGYQFSYSYHPLSIPTVKKQHIPGLEAATPVPTARHSSCGIRESQMNTSTSPPSFGSAGRIAACRRIVSMSGT